MKEMTLNDLLDELRVSLEKDDIPGAIKLIQNLQPADQADLVEYFLHFRAARNLQ